MAAGTKSADPFFSDNVLTAYGQTTAANTTLTGASVDDIAVLFTLAAVGSGGLGARVLHVWGYPTETVTAGVAYLYLSKDGGTTYRLISAVAVSADTVSTTDAPARINFTDFSNTDPLELAPGDRLAVGFSLAKIIDWVCQYQPYSISA